MVGPGGFVAQAQAGERDAQALGNPRQDVDTLDLPQAALDLADVGLREPDEGAHCGLAGARVLPEVLEHA
jgi:hypothetical protein